MFVEADTGALQVRFCSKSYTRAYLLYIDYEYLSSKGGSQYDRCRSIIIEYKRPRFGKQAAF